MLNIVIIGGSGFIGRTLSKALVSQGHYVTSISRSPVRIKLKTVKYIDCNYDNTYLLGEVYKQADLIFHLASDTTPATSSQQCSLEGMANLIPFLRFIEFMENKAKTKLVYLSSGGAIYGNQLNSNCDEKTPINPLSHYGAGKAAIENFLNAYHHQSGNEVVILRPSNIYGPGQFAKQQFGVIPTLLECIIDERPFYVSGDGSQKRDYLFIDDFCNLCCSIAQKNTPQKIQTFNCGSDISTSLKELIHYTEKETQLTLDVVYQKTRKSDVDRICLDSTKAKEVFGWQPSISLSEGIQQTWKWRIEQQ